MLNAVVSIHDVMPSTLDRVERLTQLASASGIHALTLLVVPGCDWKLGELERLRHWYEAGHTLAGHGWKHRCDRIVGWYHRLHSLVISRDVAEHLEQSAAGRIEMMRRCADWFASNGLPHPKLYVPPAWALGKVSLSRLRQTPFELIETQTGVLQLSQNRFHRLPLIGFEADTQLRKRCLRCLNSLNFHWSNCTARPLRVSLHPFDLDLLLAEDLESALRQIGRFMSYWDAVGAVVGSCSPPTVA